MNNSGDTLWLSNSSGDVAACVSWDDSDAGVSLSLVGADPLDLASRAFTDTVAAAPLPTTGAWATPHAR